MSLISLYDVVNQFQNKNGAVLTSGKLYVYFIGRTQLAVTYKDKSGTVVNPSPIVLDNNGRAPVYVDSSYNYTLVVCDNYGAEQFSQDIFPNDANGETYTGGANIEINQNVINVTGRKILAVMNPLTAYENSGRCVIAIKDGSFVNPSSLNTKLDTTAFSDVSGTFLTSHQSLSGYLPASALDGYATINWTSGMLNNKLDITAYNSAGNVGTLYGNKNTLTFNEVTATLEGNGAVVPLTTYMGGASTWRFSNSGVATNQTISGLSGEPISGVTVTGYTFNQLQPNGIWRDLKITGADVSAYPLLYPSGVRITGYDTNEITAFGGNSNNSETLVTATYLGRMQDSVACTAYKNVINLPIVSGKYPKAVIGNLEWASTDGYISIFPAREVDYNGVTPTATSIDEQYWNDGHGDAYTWKTICLNFTASNNNDMRYLVVKGQSGQTISSNNSKFVCFY